MRANGEIVLREYLPTPVSASDLTAEEAEVIWRQHGAKVKVEFPSPSTDGRYVLTAGGWVGFIPLGSDRGLRLLPKVSLGNLFGMLETAYRLKSFKLLTGLYDCRSLEEFYERLAHILARRVLDRARRGLYREYVPRDERLACVRGRIDLARAVAAPWRVRLDCRFEEHTANIADNRILSYTFLRIVRSAACRRTEVRRSVTQAFRSTKTVAPPIPIHARECSGRLYNRLNEDYRALHALCHFFLEQTGPTHESGDSSSLPFLVDMAQLFELYVTQWLHRHLPTGLEIRAQEHVPIDGNLAFRIDLVLREKSTGRALAVLDTKYKTPRLASTSDVAQVVAYAESRATNLAILVYPRGLERELAGEVGKIRVHSLAFSLDGSLDKNGERFLETLLRLIGYHSVD